MTADDRPRDDIAEMVYDQIEQAVEPEPDGKQNAQGNIWTGANQLRQEGSKNTVGYSKEDISVALERLENDDRIINWFGLVAPATDEHLRAIIQNEIQSEFTRKILVGQCNTLRSGNKDEAEGDSGKQQAVEDHA